MATKSKKNEIKAFSIDRAKWGRESLLNNDGTMCCLGHLAVACKVDTDIDLEGFGMPEHCWVQDYGYPAAFAAETNAPTHGYGPFGAGDLAQQINDNMDMSRPEKEGRLKTLFKAWGIHLTFRGKYRAGERTV